MTGQVRTPSGGAGTCNVFCWTASIRPGQNSQRAHQQRYRHDEHGDPDQDQHGRGEPRPSTEPGGDAQLER